MSFSGNACRNKVINSLRRKFKSPACAEAHYLQSQLVVSTEETAEQRITPVLQHSTETMPVNQLVIISDLYKSYIASNSNVAVPDDFLVLALSAMEHLKACGRSNVLYNLAKVLGTKREDNSDALLPAKRMPMGLIEHCINFFCSSQQQVFFSVENHPRVILFIIQVHCPDDYRQWLVSMFSLFGTKFVKLYCGPMWRVETTSQEQQVHKSRDKQPTQVCTLLLVRCNV